MPAGDPGRSPHYCVPCDYCGVYRPIVRVLPSSARDALSDVGYVRLCIECSATHDRVAIAIDLLAREIDDGRRRG